jgi:hypothetical protein
VRGHAQQPQLRDLVLDEAQQRTHHQRDARRIRGLRGTKVNDSVVVGDGAEGHVNVNDAGTNGAYDVGTGAVRCTNGA